MKKYFLMTSILALAACGGGSGGGGGAPTPAPDLLRASTLIGAGSADNNQITSMATAVVVKNDGSYSDIARAARTPDTSHLGYTVYKMDNVDFKLAEDATHTFNFEINDEGRIVRAVADGESIDRDPSDSKKFHGRVFQLVAASGSDEDLATRIVTDDSTTQTQLDTWRDEYLADTLGKDVEDLTPEDKASVKWNYLEQEWSFDTSGKDKGLTYSDFGYFTSTNVKKLKGVSINGGEIEYEQDKGSNHSTTMVFAGGYGILPNGTKPSVGAQFTGTAIGVINTSIAGGTGEASGAAKEAYEHNWENEDDGIYNHDEMAKLITKGATLTMDANGKPVIYMPFGSEAYLAKDAKSGENIQWYDVTVEDGHFIFAVPDKMKASDITKRFSHDNDSSDNPHEVVNDGYYGVTTPVEATGTVLYEQTHNLGNSVTREFNFQGAYGMVPGTPAAN